MLIDHQTGYSPRILIFSTAKDASCDNPVAAMAEHTFGVRKVAFSPDSRYLASIGTINECVYLKRWRRAELIVAQRLRLHLGADHRQECCCASALEQQMHEPG